MRYQSFEFRLFEFGVNTDGEVYINILGIDTADWGGELFGWHRLPSGRNFIDIAYMQQALSALRNWWDDRA